MYLVSEERRNEFGWNNAHDGAATHRSGGGTPPPMPMPVQRLQRELERMKLPSSSSSSDPQYSPHEDTDAVLDPKLAGAGGGAGAGAGGGLGGLGRRRSSGEEPDPSAETPTSSPPAVPEEAEDGYSVAGSYYSGWAPHPSTAAAAAHPAPFAPHHQPHQPRGQHPHLSPPPPPYGAHPPYYPSHHPNPYSHHPMQHHPHHPHHHHHPGAYYHPPVIHHGGVVPPPHGGHPALLPNGRMGHAGGPSASYPRPRPSARGGSGGLVPPPQSQHPPLPPPAYPAAALDSRGSLGSLSSYGSSESLGASGAPGTRRRGGGGGGGGRRSSRRNHRRNPIHGGGGSPPQGRGHRGWYRYDDTTTLYQMRGRIAEIAKDRDGSRFVQRRLHAADYAEMTVAFEESLESIEELWNDVYGNYILQGLLELGTDDMRDAIAGRIVDGGAVRLSTKVYGCRLVQKALDTLGKEDVARIVSSMRGKVALLVHDHNGNHVVQKSVTKINELFFHRSPSSHPPSSSSGGPTSSSSSEGGGKEERAAAAAAASANDLLAAALDVLVDEVIANVTELSVHPYGCRVVQRLIENCRGATRDRVLDAVVRNGLHATLVDHEYGNYVVQRVLAYGRDGDREAVFDVVRGDVSRLSRRKHSSNVVEMMLTYGDGGQRRAIIEEIVDGHCVDPSSGRSSAAVSMAGDAYANYVLKTVLDILEEGPTRERLFGTLIASLPELEKSPFAKQVVLRVKAYTQESTYE